VPKKVGDIRSVSEDRSPSDDETMEGVNAIWRPPAEPQERHRPAAPDRAGGRVTIVEDVRGLAGLTRGWERLERNASSPMQTAPWCQAAAEALYPDGLLKVVVLGDPGDPRAIAPLVRSRTRAELIGAAELGEPADLLFSDHQAAADLARALAAEKAPLLLRRLPRDSVSVASVKSAHPMSTGVMVRPSPGHPSIELDEGWTAPEGLLTNRRASDMRRARRHAEAHGNVSFQVLAPTPSELGPLLEEAIDVEAAGWKSREGSALRTDGPRRDFYRRYASDAARRGELRLCFMRIHGRAAAMQLALEWKRRLWLLKIGYDESFSRCSPGMLLMLESTRWAARRGLHSVELLGVEAPWTRMWTDEVRPCVTVAVYPARPSGLAALAADVVPPAADRLSRRVRELRERWQPSPA
jgi:CelD/BcsL family acetyltransferase involved in cellulose biosynthesis